MTARARDVVLLHGWGSNSIVWKDLAARLAPRCRVHTPDLPGYGGMPSREPYAVDGMAAVVAQDAPPRCHVVGWSLGAQIALAWAKTAPRQVDRLALIAATPRFVQSADWPHAVTEDVLLAFSTALAADRAGTLGRFILLQSQGDGRARQVARQLRAALAAGSAPRAETLKGGLQILLATDLRGDLGSIKQRALVLHGDRDRLTPLAAGEYVSRRLPNAQLVVLRGAAHAPFLSKPKEVAAALQEFFDE